MKIRKRMLGLTLCLCVLCGLLPVAAQATVTPGSTQENAVIYGSSITAWKTGATTFNVNGVDGDKKYQTTFQDVGYETMVSVTVGANRDRLQINPSNLIATGLRLDVDLKLHTSNYIMVQYTLKNSGVRTCDVQLGGFADVMIDKNDHAPICAETRGGDTLLMSGKPKNKYAFKLVATGTDTLWYGRFSSRRDNCFKDLENRGPKNVYKEDSALAYSWNARVAPGEVWSRCVLIGTGSLNDMNAAAPPVPTPAELIPDPAISLTTNELYLTEGDALPNWGDYVASSVGDLTRGGEPANSDKPGVYTVTYTAESGNKTARAELKVNILPRAAELSRTTVTGTDNFSLSATMNYTGGLTWTETGFVYGVIAKPTLTQNDGVVKTSRAVSAKSGALNASVPKGSLVEGLQYYARAYAKASDGTVLYGDSSNYFGVAVPKFGTFSVINNGNNTFTVSRAGGSDGVQTVYYRTVNGSAVGGTHFTHQAGKLTFKAGETTKTITIAENTANTAYSSGKPATAYSNADRTYSVEIYRVTGGGGLGSQRSATRTMKNGQSYQVARDYYTTYKIFAAFPDPVTRGDHDKDKLGWHNGDKGNAGFRTIPVSVPDLNKDYWKNTATGLSYYMQVQIKEVEDGYQHIQITPGADINTKFYPESGSYKGFNGPAGFNNMNPAAYAMTLEHGGGKKNTTYAYYSFPSRANSGTLRNDRDPRDEYTKSGFSDGMGGLLFPVTQEQISIGYSASGSGSDKWMEKEENHFIKLLDTREPKLVAIAPMAGGKYFQGDSVTISLIFDEIVDSTNSSLTSSSTITTNWGTFHYAGGADTNILYFTGTVPENASGTITLTTLTCASQIKDMSDGSGTNSSSSGTPSTTVTVSKVAKPTVSVGTIANSSGALSSTITATNAVKLEYAWSESSALPTSGWMTSGNPSSVTVKTARDAGTYYLHARATNSEGVTVTASKSVKVPATGAGAAISPELTVSLNNDTWAKTRTIRVSRSPADAKVTVKTPNGSTATVTDSSYTAAANGVYIFTLTSGNEKVTRQAVVSRIDTTAPAITINDLPGDSYPEQITLTFSVTDGGSGVKNVTAKWGAADAKLTQNSDGTYSVTCPNVTGTYRLTVTAKDKVGNSASKTAKSYTINLNAPTLTVTQTTSSNKGVTYSYSVNANGNSGVMVHLPDGTETAALTGSFTLTEPGTYPVIVTDAAGHFVSQDVTVAESVDGVAPDVRLYPNETTEGGLTVDVSVYEAGSAPTVRKDGSDLAVTDKGDGLYAGSFAVTAGGVYPVTATDTAGNTGTASVTVYALVNEGSTALKLSDDGKTYGELPTPTRTDYRFDGWYTADVDGTRVDDNVAIGTNYTLYARWTHTNHIAGAAVKENEIPATCTTNGSYDEVVYCTVCNAEVSREAKTIDALGHDVVHHDAKAPTCTEKGWGAYDTCSRCDYTTYTEIPANGHTWMNATCTMPKTCSTCSTTEGNALGHDFTGAWQSDTNKHWKKCSRCDAIDAETAHTGGAATCTEKARCRDCGQPYGEKNPSNHTGTLGDWQSNGDRHWKVYSCCGTEAEGAAHTGSTATCQEKAVCSVCGKEYGTHADHDFASEWSKDDSNHWHKCQTEGCTEKRDFAEHTPDHDGHATEKYPILCKVCGYKMEEQLSHTHIYDQEKATDGYKAADATCTSKATYYKSCSCGEKGTETFEYGELAPHSYTDAAIKAEALKSAGTCKDEAVYYYSCSVCGIVERSNDHTFADKKDAANHAGGTEIRDEKAANHKTQTSGYSGDTYCLGCGEKLSSGTTVPPSPHVASTEWQQSETEHWKICSVDGCGVILENTKAVHCYDSDDDTDCNTCGYVRTSVHTCGNATPVSGQAPGCTMNGWKDYYQCSCGRLYTTADCATQIADLEAWKSNDGKLAALDHDFTVQEYDDTRHWKKCSHCGETNTKEDHTGGTATCQAKAVCAVCGQPYGGYAAHDFDTSTWGYKDADGHAHLCQTGGCTVHDTIIGHTSSSAATETTPETCTECGYVIHAVLGHTHNWALVAEVPATCIRTGTAAHYQCSGCSQLATEADGVYTITDDTALVLLVNPDNHDSEATTWVKTETTHTEIYNCCNAIKTAETPHSGGTATCQVKAACAVCGQTYGEFGSHDYDTSAWGYKDADGHAHSCQTVDCTMHDVLAVHSYDDDSDTTCNVCGYIRSITPHSHVLRVVPAVSATCFSVGNIEHYRCEECGRLFNDSNGTRELTAADVAIGKLPHTPVTIPAVPATCEKSGMTEGSKCSVCQEVITEQTTIPALNHNWQPATCETPETCTRCHITHGDALGHEWGRYTVTTPATETSEGVETRTCTRNSAHTQTRAIPKLPSRTYGVSGGVHENGGDPAEGVKVTLVLGDRQIASTATDSDGRYSFTGVVPGIYNLVAEKEGVTMTVKVEVVSANVKVGTITMPQGKTSSVVEVKSDDAAETVEAVVGNLEKMFEERGADKPFTEADDSTVSNGGSVEIKLTVTKKDTDATSDKIKRQLSDNTNVGLRLELVVHKTVTPYNGTPSSTVVENTDVLLETIIRLPAALQGKDSYTVYRLHGTEVQKLTAARNANGEFIEVSSDKTTITIHAKLYSEYVIAYQESSGGNGGNGGGTGGSSYTPPTPSNVPDKTEENTGYRACLKEGACPIWPFTDAVPSAWYHDGVHYCIENGLMQGVSTAKFLPDGSTTRAQLVTILWRLEGSPEATKTASFGDVADGAWYAKAVRWAAGSGVVRGYDSEHFGPDDAVTREQMVTILYRYAQYKGYDVSVGEDTNILSFADAMTVSEYAIPAMQWACGSGLVTGIVREGGTFLAPADTTVRAQTATLMMRFPGALVKTA